MNTRIFGLFYKVASVWVWIMGTSMGAALMTEAPQAPPPLPSPFPFMTEGGATGDRSDLSAPQPYGSPYGNEAYGIDDTEFEPTDLQ